MAAENEWEWLGEELSLPGEGAPPPTLADRARLQLPALHGPISIWASSRAYSRRRWLWSTPPTGLCALRFERSSRRGNAPPRRSDSGDRSNENRAHAQREHSTADASSLCGLRLQPDQLVLLLRPEERRTRGRREVLSAVCRRSHEHALGASGTATCSRGTKARPRRRNPRLELESAKEFHVSPFMDMRQSYRWRLEPPGSRLVARIENLEDERRIFGRLAHDEATTDRRPFPRLGSHALSGHHRPGAHRDPLAGPAALAEGRPIPCTPARRHGSRSPPSP